MGLARSVIPAFLFFTATLLVVLFFKGQGDVYWPGLVALLVSYALMYGVGQAAARLKGGQLEDLIVAGRSLPLWIGAFSMAATWVDGGYINGAAEYTYSAGLILVQAPWCYALSLILGGIFFARKMRRLQFMTMLDPLERRYGSRVTGLLYVAALMGDIFWSGAILTALGTTFGTILGLDVQTSIVLSAAVAIAYTRAGGMWSVALTNVLQVIIILIGLFVILVYALPQVGGLESALQIYRQGMGDRADLFPPLDGWRPDAMGQAYWNWWDMALLLILGGIPWQGYFQRVLSANSEKTAAWLSVSAGFVCLLVAVPAVLIGVIGYAADWSRFGASAPASASMVLPYVLRYLTPAFIAAVGLGAVAAAVMSSVSSSVLASSSMASWNLYRPLLRPQAGHRELEKVVKSAILVIGALATLIALSVQSVYALWYLCSDLVYCILFPQLTMALFFSKANRWGALSGLAVALVLRIGGGEPLLGLPHLIPYPMVENGVVLFPFRTLAMVSGLITIALVSLLTQKWCPAVPLESPEERKAQAESEAKALT